MNQQETFTTIPPAPGSPAPRGLVGAAFLLGRVVVILEGLIESPTDAIDIRMAQDWLDDYRTWAGFLGEKS